MKLPRLVNGKLVAVIAFTIGIARFSVWIKDFYLVPVAESSKNDKKLTVQFRTRSVHHYLY